MDGRRYLLRFKGSTDSDDIICTGSYRYGRPYNEPAPNTKAWRCDCCGKFSDPYYWAEIPKRPDEQANPAIRGMTERMSVEAGEDNQEIAPTIIAAPDMLRTLESVLSLIDASSGVAGYHLNGEVATWEELALREEVEATIKKARGECTGTAQPNEGEGVYGQHMP